MGLDWQTLSLSGYYEAFEAREEARDPKAGKHEPASPEFRQTMRSIFDAQKKRKEAG